MIPVRGSTTRNNGRRKRLIHIWRMKGKIKEKKPGFKGAREKTGDQGLKGKKKGVPRVLSVNHKMSLISCQSSAIFVMLIIVVC